MESVFKLNIISGACPHGVMTTVMYCGFIASEFKNSNRAITFIFMTNTLGKGMNPLILPAMG